MSQTDKIQAQAEAWESGKLGQSEEYVGRSDADAGKALDDALGLQMISIRLPKDLINDLKIVGELNGIGYQPLIRQLLTRFIVAEKKQALRDALTDMDKQAALAAKAKKQKLKIA